ncbi:hypothetical protein [Roseomonas sp. 18066]|uniref:hypothetical protein n=1 Tax=Roseomonas sp. 18066 TaxID=2681412 RepID=UPI00135981B0|nr:hypothetical protein [Roseomonas sp. 18066]
MKPPPEENWEFFNLALMLRAVARTAGQQGATADALMRAAMAGQVARHSLVSPTGTLAAAPPMEGLAPPPPAMAPPRGTRLLLFACLLTLAGVWATLLLRPAGASWQAVEPEAAKWPEARPPQPATLAPLPGTTYTTIHRSRYLAGEVVTTWLFAAADDAHPLRQACSFTLAADSMEPARSFELGQAPGQRQPNPGYVATRMTLTEWNRAAELCRWHAEPEPALRKVPFRHRT